MTVHRCTRANRKSTWQDNGSNFARQSGERSIRSARLTRSAVIRVEALEDLNAPNQLLSLFGSLGGNYALGN